MTNVPGGVDAFEWSPDGERICRWMDGYSDYTDVPRALDRGDEEGLDLGGRERGRRGVTPLDRPTDGSARSPLA